MGHPRPACCRCLMIVLPETLKQALKTARMNIWPLPLLECIIRIGMPLKRNVKTTE